MKIAILHSGDLEKVSPGGISQYIEKLIKYNSNNEITVLGTIENESNYEIMKKYCKEIDGKKYTFIPITNNRKHPLSIYYFLKLLKIKKSLKEYDVIYAQRMEYSLPFVFSKLRKKVVVAIHGSGAYSKMYWGNFIGSIYLKIEKLALSRIARVIVLLNREEYGVPYYKRRFNDKKEKFVYGKVPIDLEYFRKNENTKKDGNIVIYFGRIDDNPKRVLLIPQIVKKLSGKIENLEFITIGDGQSKAELIEKAKRLNVSEKIIIKEKMKHGSELTKKINSAKVSIIISRFEGICMSALESLACGVPVVATDVGDIREYINTYENGIVIENSTSEQEIIDNSVIALEKILKRDSNIKSNEIYKNYEGEIIIKELETVFNNMMEDLNG